MFYKVTLKWKIIFFFLRTFVFDVFCKSLFKKLKIQTKFQLYFSNCF